MRDPFANYDAWLEQPYQDMIAEADAFYEWAESEGFDVENDDELEAAESAYNDYLESQYDEWEDEYYFEEDYF